MSIKCTVHRYVIVELLAHLKSLKVAHAAELVPGFI